MSTSFQQWAARRIPLPAGIEYDANGHEVARCRCGLLQYPSPTGKCRKCKQTLPERPFFVLPEAPPEEIPVTDVVADNWAILESFIPVGMEKKNLKKSITEYENLPKEFVKLRNEKLRACTNIRLAKHVGVRIRKLRESYGLTQKQLQGRSKTHRSYLSRIESGEMTPYPASLEKIAAGLGVSLGAFFAEESGPGAMLNDPLIGAIAQILILSTRAGRPVRKEHRDNLLRLLQRICNVQ